MKFLIDNALSHQIAKGLRDAGHDACHVNERGMGTASDETIMAFAELEDRIIISADTDFSSLLALGEKHKPSFILFKEGSTPVPRLQTILLVQNLPTLKASLEKGCVVVFKKDRMRIRELPF